jgi:hypothetical protein
MPSYSRLFQGCESSIYDRILFFLGQAKEFFQSDFTSFLIDRIGL